MTIDELARQPGEWLRTAGPMSDIVVSSRIRLARNLAGFPFLSRADEQQRQDVQQAVRQAIERAGLGEHAYYFEIDRADALHRQILVERHLISKQHAEAEGCRGVAVDRREQFAVMVNEEDHLRMQVLRSGLQFDAEWEQISRLDDRVGTQADYAFHSRYGFLTACPTNCGTGLRVSVMLHLPALKLTGQIEKVFRAARELRLAVRGLHGEGTEAYGDFYQVSNQITLGKTETELIKEFKDLVIPKIVEYERRAREALVASRPVELDDKIWRAYGTLSNARTINSEEALFWLSQLRMGVALGRIDRMAIDTVNDMFLMIQPAHLQNLVGQPLDPEQRGVARADYVRQRLGGNGASG